MMQARVIWSTVQNDVLQRADIPRKTSKMHQMICIFFAAEGSREIVHLAITGLGKCKCYRNLSFEEHTYLFKVSTDLVKYQKEIHLETGSHYYVDT